MDRRCGGSTKRKLFSKSKNKGRGLHYRKVQLKYRAWALVGQEYYRNPLTKFFQQNLTHKKIRIVC